MAPLSNGCAAAMRTHVDYVGPYSHVDRTRDVESCSCRKDTLVVIRKFLFEEPLSNGAPYPIPFFYAFIYGLVQYPSCLLPHSKGAALKLSRHILRCLSYHRKLGVMDYPCPIQSDRGYYSPLHHVYNNRPKAYLYYMGPHPYCHNFFCLVSCDYTFSHFINIPGCQDVGEGINKF